MQKFHITTLRGNLRFSALLHFQLFLHGKSLYFLKNHKLSTQNPPRKHEAPKMNHGFILAHIRGNKNCFHCTNLQFLLIIYYLGFTIQNINAEKVPFGFNSRVPPSLFISLHRNIHLWQDTLFLFHYHGIR